MKYIDAYESEERVNDDDLYIIYLHNEGDWWRAYEWSAYLCEMFPNGLKEKEKLKPTKKVLKEKEDGLISIGMKLSSFSKFLPNVEIGQMDTTMSINVKEFFKEDFVISEYKTVLNQWKSSVPFKNENKLKKGTSDISAIPFITSDDSSRRLNMLDIMREILLYNNDAHSLIENNIFLSSIKEKLHILLY